MKRTLKRRRMHRQPVDSKFIDKNHRIYSTVYSPDEYTSDLASKATGWFGVMYKIKLERLKAIAAGRKTLEVGCGSGAFLVPLLEAGIDIYGVDYAAPFVKKTQSLVGASNQHRIIECDAKSMPYKDSEFNFAYCMSTLPYVRDRRNVLEEIFRVLSSGGVAYLELGNVKSMNHQKAERSRTKVEMYGTDIGSLISELKDIGYDIAALRIGQVFPMFADDSDEKEDTMMAVYTREFMSKIIRGDVTLDEAVASTAITCDYSYRITAIAMKPTGTRTEFTPFFSSGDPSKWLARDVPFDLESMRKHPEKWFGLYARCLIADPTDCLAVYGLMRMHGRRYDELAGKYLSDVQIHYGDDVVPGGRTKRVPIQLVPDKKTVDVSVVVPVYNGMPYLEALMESLFRQTIKNFEIIVVNDGSTDGTGAYLDGLKNDKIFIKVIHQENRKLPGALNRGFSESKGRRLTWVSADCACRPDMLERLSSALEAFPQAGMAYSPFFFVDYSGKIMGKIEMQRLVTRELLIRNPGNASFMYTRDAMEKTGIYDERLVGVEDWYYWLRMSTIFPFVYIPECLYYYRLHASSMQSTMSEEINDAAEVMIQEFIKSSGDRLDLSKLYPSIMRAEMGDVRKRLIMEAQADFSAKLLMARTKFMTGITPVFLDELLKERLEPTMALRVIAHHVIVLASSGKNEDALREAGNAARMAGWVDIKDHPHAERYLDVMKAVSETENIDRLNGLVPLWTSDDPELFAMDNIFVQEQ